MVLAGFWLCCGCFRSVWALEQPSLALLNLGSSEDIESSKCRSLLVDRSTLIAKNAIVFMKEVFLLIGLFLLAIFHYRLQPRTTLFHLKHIRDNTTQLGHILSHRINDLFQSVIFHSNYLLIFSSHSNWKWIARIASLHQIITTVSTLMLVLLMIPTIILMRVFIITLLYLLNHQDIHPQHPR